MPRILGQKARAGAPVALKRRTSGLVERYQTLLIALALDHQIARVTKSRCRGQRNELGDPQAGGIKKLDDGGKAQTLRPRSPAGTGGSTIVRALATELFPTSYRGTASGWLQLLEALGAAAALFAVSWLTPTGESVFPAVRGVVFVSLVAVVVLFFIPETGRRELEEIAAER